MSLFGRSDSTLRPPPGTPQRSASDLRAALLALNGPDVSYVVRDVAPEGLDLVAEWQIVKPARKGLFGRVQDGEDFQVLLRLVPETCEVRSIDHRSEFTLTGEDPPRKRTSSRSRGQLRVNFVGYDFGRAPDGSREKRETYRFTTDDLKHALQRTVLTAGWTWHPLHHTNP